MKAKRLPLLVLPLLLIITSAHAQTTPSWKMYTIRQNSITGTVVLKVIFSRDGSVTNIRTVSGLPYGLTERAIDVARKIKFVPAMKNGKFVSMWMQLEYNFNLY